MGSGGDRGRGGRDSALYILIFSVRRMTVPVVANNRSQAFQWGKEE